jgi:hypothetical protein
VSVVASWEQFESEAPELAAAVRERLDAHTHKIMATLKRDGSPRISGIEIAIRNGELWIHGIPGSLKFKDLRRDGRVALHSGSDDAGDAGSGWPGDGKVSGLAVPVEDPEGLATYAKGAPPGPPGPAVFRLDMTDASIVRIGVPADHLIVEHWSPGQPVKRMKTG